jgi:HAD superfamily hydrolase (TIGR01509 family)
LLRIANKAQARAPLNGIVFDMDGVLLASSPIHEAAYRQALSALPIRHFDYRKLAGLRTLDGIRAVLTENAIALSQAHVEALAAHKSAIALQRIIAENPIVPGVSQVLRSLSQTHKLGLATSASPPAVNAFLDRNGLRPWFQCVVHSGEVHRAKPSPEIFQTAFLRLGLPPANCLVVEDATAGIQAAKAAGAAACGIPSTCAASELDEAGADWIIDRLEDLLDVGA